MHKMQGEIFNSEGFTKLGQKRKTSSGVKAQWSLSRRLASRTGCCYNFKTPLNIKNMKEKVLQAMREFGAPVNAGKIAEITGIDRKEVDKAFAELKKEGAIVSPVRCKWEPAK